MAGVLSFYTPSHPVPYSFNKSERNIWVKIEDIVKDGALMTCVEKDCGEVLESAGKLFNNVKEVDKIDIKRRGETVRSVIIYLCTGLKVTNP